MRLSKIKLAGFKSFVDPTTVHLVSNLVGVVGPNGSGKSNIIDAVRWVMGESSAKHLRGGSMADVIFSGSSARKPVGQASVELSFDNTVGQKLGGQYAEYNEIAVKRLVSRDGQSTYFLNGARCRRRDITDIFLGTGLGPRSYAIIEQGMISRLIEAKPEDLRTMLEEAAGISKYKERRRETENRMSNTKDNLTRINDLREELDKQLEKLQRQSRTAEKYKILKDEERQLKGELLALQWKNIDKLAREKEFRVSQLQTELESEIATQRSIETDIEKHREVHIEETDILNEVQASYYQIGAEVASKEQSIQHVKERRQELEQDLKQITQDYQEANFHQNADQTRLQQLRTNIAEIEPKLDIAEQSANEANLLLEENETQLNDWQIQWDDFTQNSNKPAQTAEVERTKITHLEDKSRELEQRYERLNQELANLDANQQSQAIEELQNAIAEIQIVVDEIRQSRGNCQAAISDIRIRSQEINDALSEKRQEMQKLSGRISSLEALQESALGKGDSQLATWLSDRRLDQSPRLAEGLQVNDGWEKAIETVLGFHLEAVCVENMNEVYDNISGLYGDNVCFIGRADNAEFNAEAGSSAISLATLNSKIATQWPVDGFLNGIYCAETVELAVEQLANLKNNESIVTQDGIWLGKNWLRINEGTDDHAGVLQREKDIKSLNETLAQTNEVITELEKEQEVSKQALYEAEERRDEVQAQLNDEERRLAETNAECRSKQSRIEQINNRQSRIQSELQEIKNNITQNQEKVQVSRSHLEEAMNAMENTELFREEMLRKRDEIRSILNESRATANQTGRELQTLQLQLQSDQSSLTATEENLSRVNQQMSTLVDRKAQLEDALNESNNPLDGLSEELEQLLDSRLEVEEQLKEVRKKVEAIDAEMRILSTKKTDAEQAVQKAREEMDQARMDTQALTVRRQTIQEQLVESNYQLAEILETLPEDCVLEEREKELAQLAQKIQRLGAINLAAIEEYKEQSERKVYLDSQYNDLVEALETLENAIKKIDKETRARFKETFDFVNNGLKEMFPKLFGGGQAYLEQTSEDLLDTGISILARPPGKRISNIHLLSGGEKALTAVALVFAIFQLNPAPFCMLDEVDAPLDEANVGRFSNLVKSMSEQVQFIFISHNKSTMEIADHLNGVTMHEPGVSRMVSVDVEEAVGLAAM